MIWFKKAAVFFMLIFLAVQFQSISFTAAQKDQYTQMIKKQGDVIISFRYQKNIDMHVVIGKCGVNQMVNFKRIYLEKNNSNKVNAAVGKKAELFMKSRTDWLGPYVVKSLIGGDGGTYAFTGGWHSIVRDNKTYKTGKTVKFDVASGNRILKENTEAAGPAVIHITNLIQGFNTNKAGRDIIREDIQIEADRGQFKVNVKTTALEDVFLMKYYGLQTQNDSWQGVQYMKGPINSIRRYSESGPKISTGIANNFSLLSKDKKIRLLCSLSDKTGLGTFDNIPGYMPTVFTESYGKTYFNLINGKGKRLNKNESIMWSGKYEFL
ncbi:MAG TPA: hypothetical protein VIO64_06640 [Pseudobacteroides sp.]|uniref:hypothetical protein n=1 Tax=Pseudobacteroides sp. TaxID=1968840 RepID=UPI002F951C00